MVFRLGELFCGPGGLGYAAIHSMSDNGGYSIKHCWANDYDADTCQTYRTNICPKNPETVICGDVRSLDIDALPSINAFAFGFPCNDFSLVGEQKGLNGDYGALYSYGIKVLRKNQPDWFLAENVGGLKNSNDGKAFSQILKALFDEGYDLFPHYYKFENYGVPQSRHRIIIVGIRKDHKLIYRIPSIRAFRNNDISVRTALTNPPILDSVANQEMTRQSETVIKRLEFIKPGQNAFNADLPDNLRLKVKGAKISQIYKRLHPDKPSYTVTGSGGGGTHVYHWSEPRALTNRERARLQTFPDHYSFCGSKESVRKQIGMAVPVEGAKVIFKAILNTFAGIEYDWDNSSLPAISHNVVEYKDSSNYLERLIVMEKEAQYD